jgi:hypothetical protein
MACYRDRFTFLYVDGVRTSQETHMGLHGRLRGQLYFFMRREGSYLTCDIPVDHHGLLQR